MSAGRPFAAQLVEHGGGAGVGKGFALVIGGDDVIHRGKETLRVQHRQPQLAQHGKGLRRGHLVQVHGGNEQLRAPVRQRACRVRIPYFPV